MFNMAKIKKKPFRIFFKAMIKICTDKRQQLQFMTPLSVGKH